jgi:hypothetical protein
MSNGKKKYATMARKLWRNEKTSFYGGMKKQKPYYMKYYGGNQKNLCKKATILAIKKFIFNWNYTRSSPSKQFFSIMNQPYNRLSLQTF